MTLTKKGDNMKTYIVKHKKIETVLFKYLHELSFHLSERIRFGAVFMAENIWNLKIGESYEDLGYKFTRVSKSKKSVRWKLWL